MAPHHHTPCLQSWQGGAAASWVTLPGVTQGFCSAGSAGITQGVRSFDWVSSCNTVYTATDGGTDDTPLINTQHSQHIVDPAKDEPCSLVSSLLEQGSSNKIAALL
ncbi:hypothetical protein HaLaN_23322 [Haematococcus lacustris]|uniref:Uncharacterized protein n=1 Tax=Haematococcus lacustris TaxID=44745 RepID=A0A6A0A4C8_HAELA|nr:hypothetical protein HaLaN_23322 [Haematococcus lacustris]